MQRSRRNGFTLVELLVVIGIIAVLMGILLPALNKARDQANTLKCSANLRSVGQGLMIYAAQWKGAFPAAYYYEGQRIQNGVQTPDSATNGYVHWSSYIYGVNAGSGPSGVSGADSFQCPSIEKGGLPPTNTTPGNLDAGQSNDDGGVVDQQVERCAYTVNEAICPRNKWAAGFQGAVRTYHYVKGASVRASSKTILATEWNQNWQIVQDASRGGGGLACKSHRPIHGFATLSGGWDMSAAPPPSRGAPGIRRVIVNDMTANPQPPGDGLCRLDWVGRNHGSKSLDAAGWDLRRTNFLYVDGHVETKHIRDTLGAGDRFEWGEKFYSLSPGDDIAQ